MKICKKCNIEKPKSEFYKDKSRKDFLCSKCKECDSACCREYRAANLEDMREKSHARYALNKERERGSRREYYAANKSKVIAMVKAYQAENPNIVSLCARNRRARSISAEGSHTAAEVKAIFESQRGLCANCNKKLFKSGKKKFHVDHIQPLAKGGSNDKYNLQCLCPSCNQRKHAKTPYDWAKENGRLI